MSAFRLWRQWGLMALTDVRMHYRRSVLGPLWVSLNTMATVGGIGFVYAVLFNIDIEEHLPYVGSGLVVWGLVTSCINEGGRTYIENAHMVRNLNLPLLFYPLRSVTRIFINFLHQMVVFIPIYMMFPRYLSPSILYAVPALALFWVNAFFTAVFIGILCARFRDLGNILSNFLHIVFLTTPILWPADRVGKAFFIEANPFYHSIEIFRDAMLGNPPELLHWQVVAAITVVNGVLAFCCFRFAGARIVHSL